MIIIILTIGKIIDDWILRVEILFQLIIIILTIGKIIDGRVFGVEILFYKFIRGEVKGMGRPGTGHDDRNAF